MPIEIFGVNEEIGWAIDFPGSWKGVEADFWGIADDTGYYCKSSAIILITK